MNFNRFSHPMTFPPFVTFCSLVRPMNQELGEVRCKAKLRNQSAFDDTQRKILIQK